MLSASPITLDFLAGTVGGVRTFGAGLLFVRTGGGLGASIGVGMAFQIKLSLQTNMIKTSLIVYPIGIKYQLLWKIYTKCLTLDNSNNMFCIKTWYWNVFWNRITSNHCISIYLNPRLNTFINGIDHMKYPQIIFMLLYNITFWVHKTIQWQMLWDVSIEYSVLFCCIHELWSFKMFCAYLVMFHLGWFFPSRSERRMFWIHFVHLQYKFFFYWSCLHDMFFFHICSASGMVDQVDYTVKPEQNGSIFKMMYSNELSRKKIIIFLIQLLWIRFNGSNATQTFIGTGNGLACGKPLLVLMMQQSNNSQVTYKSHQASMCLTVW